MSQATAATATPTTATAPTPLWGGKKLPVVGVTGEFGSGKSTFLLSIDPDCFDMSRPPRTIAWGTEIGLDSFEDIFCFEHKSLTDVMVRPGYKPEHLYLEWLGQMRATRPGQYRVGCIDTVTEIENGLADWVRRNPEHFGHTSKQYTKMEQLFWVDAKNLWQQHLSECSARFECLGFSSHAKNVWEKVGDEVRKTGERTAKGKETLWQLASLYLWLDRTPKPGSKKGPRKPSGRIFEGKMRLIRRDPTTGELEPILPPRLPEATPDAIRAYIATPADYSNLKAAERAEDEKALTDDEKLLVQSSIARDQATTAQADLSRVEMMRQAAAAQSTAMGAVPATPKVVSVAPLQSPVTTGSATSAPPKPKPPGIQILREDQTVANPATSALTRSPGSISEEQREGIIALWGQLQVPPEAVVAMLASRDCQKLAEMPFDKAGELLVKLQAAAAAGDIPF